MEMCYFSVIEDAVRALPYKKICERPVMPVETCTNNVKILRQEADMTIAELASELGVSRRTIVNWEHGGAIGSVNLVKMSELFDARIDYILAIDGAQAR